MKGLRILCLLAMIQFAFAGSSGDDDYERDNDKEVIIKAITAPWKFPYHIKATHAILVGNRDFYTSNIYGIDSYGNIEKGLKAQIEQIIKNILYLLEAVKLKLKNVLTVTVIVDIEYLEVFFQIYEDYFPKKQFPTIFIFEGKLPKNILVQVSVTAIVGNIKYIKYDGHDGRDDDEY